MFVAPGTTTAFALATPLRDYWLSLGGPSGPLGYPIDERPAEPRARREPGRPTFQHGQASWNPTTGGVELPGKLCLIILADA